MYNYHPELVFKIDVLLIGLLFLLALATIVYAGIKEYAWHMRSRALSRIKRHVYELALSGKKADAKVCIPELSDITIQHFLDVETNRNRDLVFFNETEQKVLKECFSTNRNILKLEKIAFRSWNKWWRIEAILSLGYAQSGSSLHVLKKTINAKDDDVSYFSIIALAQMPNISSARILLHSLKRHKLYRYKILSILKRFPNEIAEEAVALTGDPDPEIRAWAIELISGLKSKQYIKTIEQMVSDKSENVRAAACDCLGEFGSKEAKPLLIKCLRDDFWLVRAHTAIALSKILGADSIPEVIGLINDPSLSVVDSLKSIMIEHVDAAAIYLEKFLHSEDDIAKRTAIEVMDTSGYIAKLLKDILSEGGTDKDRAMKLLEGLIVSRAYLSLEVVLSDMNPSERHRIIHIIEGINKDAAEYLDKKMKAQAEKRV